MYKNCLTDKPSSEVEVKKVVLFVPLTSWGVMYRAS